MSFTENDAISYAKATLEIEGRTLSPDGEALIRRRMNGEISHDEFLQLAKDLAETNHFMSSAELEQACELATHTAKEKAASAGTFISYSKDGKLFREYPDGTIKEVVYDGAGNRSEVECSGK